MFDLGLRDKVAIVTGGSDGLGCATAQRLASEGAKVVICGRREDYLRQAAGDVLYQRCVSHGCKLTEPAWYRKRP